MAVPDTHTHSYRRSAEFGSWRRVGDVETRDRVPSQVCSACGARRPTRRPPTPDVQERRSATRHAPPPPLPPLVVVAAALAKGSGVTGAVSMKSLVSAGREEGITQTDVESALECLLPTGWFALVMSVSGTRREIQQVSVSSPEDLQEFAHPGRRQALSSAVSEGLRSLERIDHPSAAAARDALRGARRLTPELARALCAVAVHASKGDELPVRVLSAIALGDSKAIPRLRKPLEARLGPLAKLGLGEATSLTLLGGRGLLSTALARLDVSKFLPYLGLPREFLSNGLQLVPPEGGVLAVENLEMFEACCRSQSVLRGSPTLVLWLGGWPGRGEEALVRAAHGVGSSVRVWADLDRSGIGIARRVIDWAPRAKPFLMGEDALRGSPRRKALSREEAALIKRDLEHRPDAPLASTLRAILELGQWCEQETLLGMYNADRSESAGAGH
jgi:Wadjet anti plasmid transformation system JetA-like protein